MSESRNLDQREISNLRKEIEQFQNERKYLKIMLLFAILILFISPGFTVLSNHSFQKKLEVARKEAIESEWLRFYKDESQTYFVMTCLAYEEYFNNTASPALERWLREDFDLGSMENWCHNAPVPETVWPDP